MHEYSIVSALIENVGTHVASGLVRAIRIEIGSLAGVEASLLMTAFEVARFGTKCADASLEITAVDAQWACPRCERILKHGARLQCPDCQLPAALTRGDEIVLTQIEIEVDDAEENCNVPEGS